MKKTFLIISFIASALACHSQGYFDGIGSYDCESHESYTDWMPQDSLGNCTHDFVYAEWGDVNAIQSLTFAYAVSCPCGCGGSSNEARICSKCLLSQKRVRSWWYESIVTKSEYIQLIEKLEKQ